MSETIKPNYSNLSIDEIVEQNRVIAQKIAEIWHFKPTEEQRNFCTPIANYLLGIQASRELEKVNRIEDALAVLDLHDYSSRARIFDVYTNEVAEIHGICRYKDLIPQVGNKYCDKNTTRAYKSRLEDTVKQGSR